MRIKNLCIISLLAACLLTSGIAAAATTHLALKNKDVVALVNGKEVLVPKTAYDGLNLVAGADIRLVGVGEDLAKNIGVEAGFYFFDAAGTQVAVLPHEGVEAYMHASLSPHRKTLALNIGGYLVCTVAFYSWPDLKPLAQSGTKDIPFLYPMDEQKPVLLWVSDTAVIFNTMGDTQRPCDYDPCGVSSVMLFDLSTNKLTPVQVGTDLCDYSFAGYRDGTVTVRKSCMPTVEAWKIPEGQHTETISVPLPR